MDRNSEGTGSRREICAQSTLHLAGECSCLGRSTASEVDACDSLNNTIQSDDPEQYIVLPGSGLKVQGLPGNWSAKSAVRVVTFSFLCPLLEKYGTFIARCNALIEKVSSFRQFRLSRQTPATSRNPLKETVDCGTR
eukprot:SAG31_NODE_3949_length_3725_cov_1.821566_5_plen_137_part_00